MPNGIDRRLWERCAFVNHPAYSIVLTSCLHGRHLSQREHDETQPEPVDQKDDDNAASTTIG